MATVHLLLNPSAVSKRRAEADAAIRRSLASHADVDEVIELHPPGVEQIVPTLERARHEGVTRLLIAGGDGLLHRALPAIAGTGMTVGIVAVGTGNDFARALGLPTSRPEAAVDAALADPTAIDLISTTAGQWAATVVTGGFSGRVNARANTLRLPIGQHRYTAATLLELPRLQPVPLDLVVDGTHHHLDASLFAVANTRFFGGGMAICPNAVPADGLLDVTVVGPTSRRELARVLPTVFTGSHLGHPSVTVYRGRRIELTTAAPLWADGEPLTPSATAADPAGTATSTTATATATTASAKNGPEANGETVTTSFMAAPGALRVAGTLVGT